MGGSSLDMVWSLRPLVSTSNHQSRGQMAKDITADADKFDAVLRRMTQRKPMSIKDLSARLKAEKIAKTADGAAKWRSPGTK